MNIVRVFSIVLQVLFQLRDLNMGNECIRNTKDDTPRKSKENAQIPKPQHHQKQNQTLRDKQNLQEIKLDIKHDSKVTTFKMNEAHLFCLICKEKYNKQARMPVKICQQEHTICATCKDMLLSTKVQRYKVCPFCKRLLNSADVAINQALLASLA